MAKLGLARRVRLRRCILAAAAFVAGALGIPAQAASPPDDGQLRWWRGNIHTHTLWSDGNDFPEMVADWYRSHGYHFLALSDHNVRAVVTSTKPHHDPSFPGQYEQAWTQPVGWEDRLGEESKRASADAGG